MSRLDRLESGVLFFPLFESPRIGDEFGKKAEGVDDGPGECFGLHFLLLRFLFASKENEELLMEQYILQKWDVSLFFNECSYYLPFYF